MLPDAEVRTFVQRAVGYSLTGDTSEQVLFFLHGSGANGKSTFIQTLFSLLGDYALQGASDLLLEKRGGGVPCDIADLQGRRFIATVEVADGRKMAEAVVKQLTGGDVVNARRLYGNPFQFIPSHKIWLVANHKPVVRGQDHAIWRRIRLVPFDVTIVMDDRDPRLPLKLAAERSGILNWALEGCLGWQRDGLGCPAAVSEATEQYRSDNDIVGTFLEDCCVLGSQYQATSADLYRAYASWCHDNAEHPIQNSRFGRLLGERGGLKLERGTGGTRRWRGIRLASAIDLKLEND